MAATAVIVTAWMNDRWESERLLNAHETRLDSIEVTVKEEVDGLEARIDEADRNSIVRHELQQAQLKQIQELIQDGKK